MDDKIDLLNELYQAKLDDLRQISIVGFKHETHVTITNTNNDDCKVDCTYATTVAEDAHLFELKRFLHDY